MGVGGLESASGHQDTVSGRITCAWKVEGRRAELSIVVPIGTTAKVRISTPSPRLVRENGAPAANSPGITNVGAGPGGEFTCEATSGSYRFTFAR